MIYETTDIKLSAVILCEIQGAYFAGINGNGLVNSKKVIKIEYPEQYKEDLNKLVGDYMRKVQIVNVYHYNKNLCLIRDNLFTGEGRRGMGHGTRPY